MRTPHGGPTQHWPALWAAMMGSYLPDPLTAMGMTGDAWSAPWPGERPGTAPPATAPPVPVPQPTGPTAAPVPVPVGDTRRGELRPHPGEPARPPAAAGAPAPGPVATATAAPAPVPVAGAQCRELPPHPGKPGAVPQEPPAPLVRRITLDAGGLTLSALLCQAQTQPPRAVVVAVHGGGMSAGYFHAPAHAQSSLLTLGARLGFTVLAVDRPGYGHSTPALPHGLALAGQSELLRAALADFAARHATGAGLFLLAHSFGGKLALSTAAAGENLLGLDISGCGHRYAVPPDPPARSAASTRLHWGPLRLYPPDTFRTSTALIAPMPARERAELALWPQTFDRLAPRVRVPLRFTFAEHESLWHHGEADLADLRARLSAAPRVSFEHQAGAGHNISLGWAARAYHLRALAFAEDCLAGTL